MSSKRKTPAKKKPAKNGKVAKTAYASEADFPKNRCRALYASKGAKAAHALALELGASQGKADRWMREFAEKPKVAPAKKAPAKKAKGVASRKTPKPNTYLNGKRTPRPTHREHRAAA